LDHNKYGTGTKVYTIVFTGTITVRFTVDLMDYYETYNQLIIISN